MTSDVGSGAAAGAAAPDSRARIRFYVAEPNVCSGCGSLEFLRADIPLPGDGSVMARLCMVCDTDGAASRLQEFLLTWDFEITEVNSRGFADAARAWLLSVTDPPLVDRVQWFVSDPGCCGCGAQAVLRAEVPTSAGRVLHAVLCMQCPVSVEAARLLEFLLESDGLVSPDNAGEFLQLGSDWLRSGAPGSWVEAAAG